MPPPNDLALPHVNKPLIETQVSLKEHFQSLKSARGNRPNSVFALEHNLSPLEVADLREKLSSQHLNENVIRDQWLLWVVYATELGYEYIGEEYWPSFGNYIPNWHSNLRPDLKWAFNTFQQKFNGISPVGRWADHFSIISWPITNAFLPKYLQTYFARLLYSVRFKLQATKYTDATAVGRIMASHSGQINSDRFLNFLEHEELVGRIAISMLKGDTAEQDSNLISTSTLTRVISDLEKKRSAKQWMKVARQDFQTRFHGAEKSHDGGKKGTSYSESGKKIIRGPILMLQRTSTNGWDVAVEITGFGSNLNSAASILFLKSTRFRINGSKGTWQPAERLISGTIKQNLAEWPPPGQWLRLEKEDQALQSHLSESYNVPETFPLVFKLSGNIAKQIVSKNVRSNCEYIVIFNSDTDQSGLSGSSIVVNCSGVTGILLRVPEFPSQDQNAFLLKLGLIITRTVKIWPAGLTARHWDDEGISEWLSTDTPIFGIVHDDLAVTNYKISFGTNEIDIAAKAPGMPTFLRLPKLSSGNYSLKIKPIGNGHIFPIGEMIIDVRDPISWSKEFIYQYTFAAFLDPFESDLDSFMAGKSDLNVVGPRDTNFSIQFDFHAGGKLLKTKGPKDFRIPLDIGLFRQFQIDAMKDEEFAIARTLHVTISAGDLGIRNFRLSRDIKPIRWYYSIKHNTTKLTLIDETDSIQKPTVQYYSFDEPIRKLELPITEFTSGNDLSTAKGMIKLTSKQFSESIIVSRLQTNKSLDGFGIDPRIPEIKYGDLVAFSKCTAAARSWYNAKCMSYIATLHQQQIARSFVKVIITYVCGKDWMSGELRFVSNSNLKPALIQLSRDIGHRILSEKLIDRILTRDPKAVRPDEEKAWFTNTIHNLGVVKNKSLAYFAIKLASNPFLFDEEFNGSYSSDLSEISKNHLLIRAARLYTLGISHISNPNNSDIEQLINPSGFRWK